MTLLKTLDGQTITVPKKDIKEYEKSCKNVKNPAPKVVKFSVKNLKKVSLCGFHTLTAKQAQPFMDSLPCADGFFFGSTDYNGWYVRDIIDTYFMLDEVIETASEIVWLSSSAIRSLRPQIISARGVGET